MEPYSGALARYYDQYFIGLDGDVDFYRQQALDAGGTVLELGCGTGRILIPSAAAGVQICGLECAPQMLAQLETRCRALPPDQARRIEVIPGDMQDFSLGRTFQLITIPYRTFQHALTPTDQEQVLHCVHQHLEEGGRLAFNTFDPQRLMASYWHGHGAPVCHDTDFIDKTSGQRIVVSYARQFDPELQLMEQELIFDQVAASGQVEARYRGLLRLRYAFRYELEYLLELCGFRVEALYGDFYGGAYPGSGEQVWLATRL